MKKVIKTMTTKSKQIFYRIITPSMSPVLKVNDMVVLKNKPPKDIKVGEKDGDILILKGPQYFYDNGMEPFLWNNLSPDTPIIHRAIDKKKIDGVYYFKTKGDNSWATDGAFRIGKRKKKYIIIDYDESKAIYVPESEVLGVVGKKVQPSKKENISSPKNYEFVSNLRKFKRLQIKVLLENEYYK